MTRALMDEINGRADIAAKEPRKMIDRMALAEELQARYTETPLIEVIDKLNAAWRRRGLFFAIAPRR